MYLLPQNLCHVVEISQTLRFEIFKKYGNISKIFDEIFQNKKYRIFTSVLEPYRYSFRQIDISASALPLHSTSEARNLH